MRVAARVLGLGIAIVVLGTADARAPDLRDGPTALAGVTTRQDPSAAPISANDDAHEARIATRIPGSASTSGNHDSIPDLWLLGGVCFGLVAYQLRRKHKLLRPQPFLRPEL